MRKEKSVIAFVLTIAMLVAYIPINSMEIQADGFNKKQELTVMETWEQKISEKVWEKLETTKATEKIPVWIWFTDIDHQEVEKRVQENTGLSADTLAVSFAPIADELKRELEEDIERQDSISEETLSSYIRETEEQRNQERHQTKTYIREQRAVVRDAYVKKNQDVVEKLDLLSEDIIFQSELTPSVIVCLTKERILEVAQFSDVVSVEFCESEVSGDTQLCDKNIQLMKENITSDQIKFSEAVSESSEQSEECDHDEEWDRDFKAIRGDAISEQSGLTGEGVNVVVLDRYIRSDQKHYKDLKNREKIWLVKRNNTEQGYEVNPLLSISNFGENSVTNPEHGNLVAARLQKCAKDVNIYSISARDYKLVEKVILGLEIDIINVSMNYDDKAPGIDEYHGYYIENAVIQWFEKLVKNTKVILIASGGNQPQSYTTSSYPGAGYNTIGVGAYNVTNTNIELHDFKFNPTTGYDCVNYKPDIAMPADSTSEAAPFASGVAAMMIQLKPSLAVEPETVKAILMASCHRKASRPLETPLTEEENMSDGLTKRQGAGAVDAYRAVSIVALEQYGTNEISSGYQDIYIGKVGKRNVNVSIAWHQDPTKIISNNTLLVENIRELELQVLPDPDTERISAKTNAGKQMVYFTSFGDEHTIRITKMRPMEVEGSNEIDTFRYAYAWSTEDISYLDLEVTATEVSCVNGMFTYGSIQFSEAQELYNNRNIYVIIKKHSCSDVVYSSPVYAVNMNGISIGMLTDLDASARSYTQDEHIEILMYSANSCTDETLISKQFFYPALFDLNGW